MTRDVTDFQKDVIERSYQQPVLVDFWAEWCGPCKMLGPVLEKVAGAHTDEFDFVKVDTEQHQQLAMEYNIRSIPNVKLFVDGDVHDEFSGALPEAMVEIWLRKALPGKSRHAIAAAREHIKKQELTAATTILEKVLQDEPHHAEASLLLARCILTSAPEKAMTLLDMVEAGTPEHDAAAPLRDMARLLLLARRPETLPEGPARPMYLRGLEKLQAGEMEMALESFIDVLRNDRAYDDDGARKAIISIFKFLGEEHPLTQKFRPVFSRALYI